MRLPPRWSLALAGLAVGGFDTLLTFALGIRMQAAGVEVTLAVMAWFTGSFVLCGYLIGRLVEARRALQQDAATIAAQVEALRQAQARVVAAETLASLGRMAASVAHEVRNPLGVIRSSAALIAEGLPPAARRLPSEREAAEASAFILDEVDRLESYVSRILDFSRPLSPRRDPTSLAAAAERARRLAEPHLGGAAVQISGEAPPLQGDEDLLTRLLLGLLINAGQAGARQVQLQLSGEREAVLLLSDDGPGFPEGAGDAVFEPFFTTRASGTGLGLALARRVAEAHGGQLGRATGPGGALCLRLPLEAP